MSAEDEFEEAVEQAIGLNPEGVRSCIDGMRQTLRADLVSVLALAGIRELEDMLRREATS